MLHSLFTKHLNARRAKLESRGNGGGKKRENCANPLKKCLEIFVFFAFPFFFSYFFLPSLRELNDSYRATAPTPRLGEVAKLCLNQKSQQTSEGCQLCFVCGSVCLSVCLTTLGCACCEVNVAHILYPAFWLLSIAYYPLPPSLSLFVFSFILLLKLFSRQVDK